jgi:hypothetical protein
LRFHDGYFGDFLQTTYMKGGTAAGSSLELRSTSGAGNTDYIKFTVGNNGGTEAMRIIDSGYVGIGTPAPSTTLQVAGASSTIRIGTASLPGCIEVGNSDGSPGINYVTFLNGVMTATTTKPSNCQ